MSVLLTELASGLRVVTDVMPWVETVSVGCWVEAGTRHESRHINGISHLLEHMAFKGTERRDARRIAEEIENVGGQINAYTSREHTAYYAKVLKEDVPMVVDILADIIQNSRFDPEELAREQAVILQEIKQANDTPDDIVFDHFQATAFPDQPLGWPVLGTEEIVNGLQRETLLDFMGSMYALPRMVLCAAGNINHEALVDLAGAFLELPEKAQNNSVKARYGGGVKTEQRDIKQINLVAGFEGLAYDDPDYYALSILSALFGGGMSSRLFQEVREKRGLVYTISSFASSYADGGLFGIYAGTGPEEIDPLMEVIRDEIGKVKNHVSDNELNRAKAQLKAGILMAMENTGARCEQRARHVMIFGRPLSMAEIVAKIEAVEASDICRVASRVMSGKTTLAAIGPLQGLDGLESWI